MDELKNLWLLIRFGGLRHAMRILRYTLFKQRLDWSYMRQYATTSRLSKSVEKGQDPVHLPFSQRPRRLLHAVQTQDGGKFTFERRFSSAELQISFLAPDLVRVSWGPGMPPVPYALAKIEWPVVETKLWESDEGWVVSSVALEVVVRNNGSLCFRTPGGRPLRHELPPVQDGERWIHRARLSPDERLFGLGEQAGALSLRSGQYRMWNSDPGGSYGPGKAPLYAPIPLYLSLQPEAGYLVFYENSFPATLTLGPAQSEAGPLLEPDEPPGVASLERSPALQTSHNEIAFSGPTLSQANFVQTNPAPLEYAEACFEGGKLQYYFIPGRPAQTLERYTELTGRAALPPIWSLGYHQSRWGYKSESEIREVAAGFEAHAMPISAIHLDIDYMDGFRVFTVDPLRFPDLKQLAGDMASQGIRLVTIVDPAVKRDPDYMVYQEGLKEKVFCTLPDGKVLSGLVWPGWSAYPDFTDPATRAWWGQYYPRLLDAGIAGIWHDMNEPTSFAAWGDLTLPLATRHSLEGRGGDHRQAHNLYALLMNQAGLEALRKHFPERRPWIISRAGWAGQQRYAWNWTGDTESSWEGLRMTLPTILGMGLCGLPFTGPDIGGFSGSPSAELYLRSFQTAAFLPFFRTHSSLGTARREPWVYGEPYTGIIRNFLHLRYHLLPYLYTLAWQAGQTGHPIVRPLFWNRWEEMNLWEVEDAFMLGETLLVAPILEEGAQARDLTLPAGTWFSFWDDQPYQGPGTVKLPACLEQIPLLVRAGSILPVAENDRLVLHIYPPEIEGDPGEDQILYSDGGEGYGAHRLDRFHLAFDDGLLELTWSSEGEFSFPYTEIELRIHNLQPEHLWLDGEEFSYSDAFVLQNPCARIRFG